MEVESERGSETMTSVFEYKEDTEMEGEQAWDAQGGTGGL